MSHRTRRRLQLRFASRALALALIVLAVPLAGSAAAVGGPVMGTPCAPGARNASPPVDARLDCVRGVAHWKSARDGNGSDAGLVAGGAALVALITVGGTVVAARRRGPQPTRPVIQH